MDSERLRGKAGQVAFGAIMMLAMAMGNFVPFALGTLGPFIIEDLGTSMSRIGFLVTCQFAIATILSLIAGRAADSPLGQLLVIFVFGMAALSLIGLSLAPNFWWMLAAVVMAGTSQAASNPATNKMISAYGRTGFKGILVGVKQSGVHLGGLLAGSLLPLGASVWGWRHIVAATAILPIAGFIASGKVLPNEWPEQNRGDPSSVAVKSDVRWLTAYAFLMGGGIAGVIAYLPLYAHQRLDIDASIAGLFVAALSVTGIASRIVWGHVSERLRDVSVLLAWLAFAAALMQVVIWAAEGLGSWFLWVGSLGLGASAVAWNAVGMLAIVKEIGFAKAGIASGTVLVGFFGGFIVSPTVFGLLVEFTDAYHYSWGLGTLHFLLASFVAIRWKRERRARDQVSNEYPSLPTHTYSH